MPRAGLGQRPDDLPAVQARAAGDQRDLALEREGVDDVHFDFIRSEARNNNLIN